MIPGINAQVDAMRTIWPALELVGRDSDSVEWRGPLRPLLQTYRVCIRYRVPALIEAMDPRRLQPRVSVLAPALRPRRGDAEGSLPHVYYASDGTFTLCLLDPEAGDWSPADLLAETTVGWTIEWLAAYEGWRATGSWTASGRHVERASG